MASKSALFSIRSPLSKQTAFVLGLLAPALVLGAWCGLTYSGYVRPDFLPTPTEVGRGTLQLFLHYDLTDAILISTRRLAIAFLCASINRNKRCPFCFSACLFICCPSSPLRSASCRRSWFKRR